MWSLYYFARIGSNFYKENEGSTGKNFQNWLSTDYFDKLKAHPKFHRKHVTKHRMEKFDFDPAVFH